MKKVKAICCFGIILMLVSCDFGNAGGKNKTANSLAASLNTSDETSQYDLALAFPNLEFDSPVELTAPDDNSDRIFVLAQKGIIHVFPNRADVKKAEVFLDISQKVESGGEKGLLGLAFHPDYKSNGYFYV